MSKHHSRLDALKKQTVERRQALTDHGTAAAKQKLANATRAEGNQFINSLIIN